VHRSSRTRRSDWDDRHDGRAGIYGYDWRAGLYRDDRRTGLGWDNGRTRPGRNHRSPRRPGIIAAEGGPLDVGEGVHV
jgi:hypothetical protein